LLALAPLAALTVTYGIVQGLLTGGSAWNIAAFADPLLLAVFECALALAGYAHSAPTSPCGNTERAAYHPEALPHQHPHR